MMPIFRRSVPELSLICNQVTDWIYNTHGLKVTRWNHGILNPPLIATYADAVHSKGAALDNCFSFIDGTVRPISRPMSDQGVVYNSHRRVHALKFQAATLPSGLIANIYSQSNLFSLHWHVYGIFLSFYLPLTFALFFGEIVLIIDNGLFDFLFPRRIPYALVKCKACMT